MASASLPTIPPELRDQLEVWIEQIVDQRLIELLGDPDQGREVREELVERLREQQKRVAAGELGMPYNEVQQRLGLK